MQLSKFPDFIGYIMDASKNILLCRTHKPKYSGTLGYHVGKLFSNASRKKWLFVLYLQVSCKFEVFFLNELLSTYQSVPIKSLTDTRYLWEYEVTGTLNQS